jgi:hypothetical protein
MVVSVREMAEAAVGAIEWNYQRMVGKAVDKEWECAEVEKELESERKENSRLRAIIAMYEQAFCQLHQQKIEDGYFSEELSMEVSPFVMLICFPGFVFNYIANSQLRIMTRAQCYRLCINLLQMRRN